MWNRWLKRRRIDRQMRETRITLQLAAEREGLHSALYVLLSEMYADLYHEWVKIAF